MIQLNYDFHNAYVLPILSFCIGCIEASVLPAVGTVSGHEENTNVRHKIIMA